jgi:hypothetical protein
MEHPLRNARLLEVSEPERPSGVGRVNHVTDAEGQGLPPDHDLVADIGGQWTPLILPPGVTDGVLVVKFVPVHAQAIRADERIGRLVHESFAHEKAVVLIQFIILVDLEPSPRGREIVAAGCIIPQRGRILPHAERLAKKTRDMQPSQGTILLAGKHLRQHPGGRAGNAERIS